MNANSHVLSPGQSRKLWHGGDYNPDQWLNRPEIIDDDFHLFPKANFNVLSVGIFAWAQLEPTEGTYQFGWLDAIFDRCEAAGMSVFLSTPSAGPPAWMTQRYPEILRVEPDRTRRLPGQRVKWCPTSPVWRGKVSTMNRALAERYGHRSSLALWHISNEYLGECHCDLCQAAFRKWLVNEYGTLDALNVSWWTNFWSHTYSDWDQISSPCPHGENESVHGLALSWKRFVTDQYADFLRQEIAAIRTFSRDVQTSTNFHPGGTHLDYRVVAKEIDVISWDAYPSYHDRDIAWADGGWNEPVAFSFTHDLYRSMKEGQPFLLMETTPSSANWMGVPKLKRPGVARFTALQAIAHGADSVLYFQWRAGRGGEEKFHGAVLEHGGGESSRVFREVAETGDALRKLQLAAGTTFHPQVAIGFDWDNRWALSDVVARGTRHRTHYPWEQLDIYRVYWEAGVGVTFPDLRVDAFDARRFPLLIIPMQYMLRDGLVERLRRYVEAGGTLVTGYFSGTVDKDDLVFDGGMHPGWRELVGIRREETDFLFDDEKNSICFASGNDLEMKPEYAARVALELCEPERATVLATYGRDFYAGRPALTVNAFGQGRVYYQCARSDQAFLSDFHGSLMRRCGIVPHLPSVQLPQGVTIQKRVRSDGQSIYFFLNATRLVKHIPLGDWRGKNIETEQLLAGTLVLDAYGCIVALDGSRDS